MSLNEDRATKPSGLPRQKFGTEEREDLIKPGEDLSDEESSDETEESEDSGATRQEPGMPVEGETDRAREDPDSRLES